MDLLTTREAAWYMISVVSVSLTLSVIGVGIGLGGGKYKFLPSRAIICVSCVFTLYQ